jgi:flagellar secretion chaperone FliS
MMWRDAYLESRVMAADPMELIRILYQSAIESVQSARRFLAAGEIAERSKSICHAIAVISVLNSSLNHSVNGNISRELEALYQYIRQRLTEANLRQQDGPLAEAQSLLTTLAEAWQGSKSQHEATTRPSGEPVAQASVWEAVETAQLHTWSA